MAPNPQKINVRWIDAAINGPEYLAPDYYDSILKPYIFSGVTDLELFRSFLTTAHLRERASALEIGPGTGRATRVFSECFKSAEIDLVDQSQQMLSYLRAYPPAGTSTRLIRSDAITYLA